MSDDSSNAISGIRVSRMNIAMIVVALAAAALLFLSALQSIQSYQWLVVDTEHYLTALQAASDMKEASDYLTTQARMFSVTGDPRFVTAFFEEKDVSRRRDRAIEKIRAILADKEALLYLEQAMAASRELELVEFHAMRLKAEAEKYDLSEYPESIRALELSKEEKAYTAGQLRQASENLVYGEDYQAAKEEIYRNVNACTQSLVEHTRRLQVTSSEELSSLLKRQEVLAVVMLLVVLALVLCTSLLLIRPLQRGIRSIRESKHMPTEGCYEVRFLAHSYNEMFEHTRQRHNQLSYEATHDPLTGIYNRKAYEKAYAECNQTNVALIVADVDGFKSINDTYGHSVGDRVLKRVAELLTKSFRSEDYVCRIGGDEFAVLMMHANSSLAELVQGKLMRINEKLQKQEDGLPSFSLSVGIAFSDRERPQGDLFLAADTALYRVKNSGRGHCAIYSEREDQRHSSIPQE